jgi:hypothetical protein
MCITFYHCAYNQGRPEAHIYGAHIYGAHMYGAHTVFMAGDFLAGELPDVRSYT